MATLNSKKHCIVVVSSCFVTALANGQGAVSYEIPAVSYQKIVQPNKAEVNQSYQIAQAQQNIPAQNYQAAQYNQYQVPTAQVAPNNYSANPGTYQQPQIIQQYQQPMQATQMMQPPQVQQPQMMPQQQIAQPQMQQPQQNYNNRNLSQNYVTSMQPTSTSSSRTYNYPTSTAQSYGQQQYAGNFSSAGNNNMTRQMTKRGGIYGQVGLGGLGLGVTYHINPYSNIRGEYNGGLSMITEKLIKEKSYGGVALKPSARIGDIGLFYDFYPANDSDMHFTAGFIQGRSEVSLVAVESGNTTSALIRMPKSAFYLGLGWGHSPLKTTNMTFFSEIGLILGKTEYSVSSGASTSVSDDVKKLADKLRFYPVYKMGVDYDFF